MAKRTASETMPVLSNISGGLDTDEFAQIRVGKDNFVVGRGLTCSFIIPDVTISRRHCVFHRSGDAWSVTDESTTGLFVNGQKVQKGTPVTLKTGDQIKFGFNSKWQYIFSLSEDDYDGQIAAGPGWKKAKTTSDDKLQIQATIKQEEKETENAAGESDADVAGAMMLDDNEMKILTQENSGDVNSKGDERKPPSEEELQQRLLDAKKLTENINREHKQVLSALVERDHQLLTLQKNTQMEKLALQKQLKELQALLAEKERKEEEDKRRLEEETKRVQILEEEKKKQEEYNKTLVEQLVVDIEEREKTAKLRLQEVLKDLNQDRIAIESEIQEKCEANEDVGKLFEELETVKQKLLIVDQKREILEKELSEAKSKVAVCTMQAREEIMHNLGVLMETELQCSICNELFLTATTLTCNHTFCKFCITQWKKKKKECPVCRKKISSEYRSISLDNFISKMIENLSEEIKEKRKELVAEREALEKENPKTKKKEKKRRSHYSNLTLTTPRVWHLGTTGAGPSVHSTFEEMMIEAALSASRAATSTSGASTPTPIATFRASTSTSGASASTSRAPTLSASTSTSGRSTSDASTSTRFPLTVLASTSTASSATLTSPATSTLTAATSSNGISTTAATTQASGSTAAVQSSPVTTTSPRSPAQSVSPPLTDYVIVDLTSSSMSESDTPGSSDYSSDSSYAEGVPGSYYGGYGNCYHCGRSGHWANGCPDMH